MNRKILAFSMLFQILLVNVHAQNVDDLLKSVRAKYDKVNDYVAEARLKTNVSFIKAPVARVRIYFKKPDKLRIKNENGISLIPKGSININISNLIIPGNFQAIDGGMENVGGVFCKIVRIFPNNDNADITRSTLYIDEKRLLVLKSVVSTKENGSYELLMHYAKWASFALADSAEFSFNTRDYKLPKGVTIDYDNGSAKNNQASNKKGKVEIVYLNYIINKGLSDSVFN
jgi:hypothetical protein